MVHVTMTNNQNITLKLKDGRSSITLVPGESIHVEEKDWHTLKETGLFTIYEELNVPVAQSDTETEEKAIKKSVKGAKR